MLVAKELKCVLYSFAFRKYFDFFLVRQTVSVCLGISKLDRSKRKMKSPRRAIINGLPRIYVRF